MMIYDYIIIGSGISGLYTAHLLQKNQKTNFLILEKRNCIGGRIKTFPINKNKVPVGAGIGRKSDTLLKMLLTDMDVNFTESKNVFYYSDNLIIKNIYNILHNINSYSSDFLDQFYKTLKIPIDYNYDEIMEYISKNIKKILSIGRLKNEVDEFDKIVYNNIKHIFFKLQNYLQYLIIENKYKPISFKNFCLSILDIETYETLINNMAFTDYEEEDAFFSLKYYNFEDNYEKSDIFYIKWDELLHNFEKMFLDRVRLNCQLLDIEETNDGHFHLVCDQYIETDIKTKNEFYYKCKKIIFANNLDIINKFYDYNFIKSQPFLRVYCKVDTDLSKKFLKKLKENGSTIVNNELKKIININRNDGIFMISYCDNKNANLLSNYRNNNIINIKIFKKLIIDALDLKDDDIFIDDIYVFFWNVGTHYYKFTKNENIDNILPILQNPIDNIYVVGECISKKQGWCEGALESVNNILNLL